MNRGVTAIAAVAGVIIMALTLVVFAPSLDNGFVNLDDETYVVGNAAITSLDDGLFKWAFTTFYAYNYHPLTWISLAVDYRLWGLNPLGYHATNLLLHGLNAFLVVLLAFVLIGQALSVDDEPEKRLQPLLASAMTGMIFGLHPLRVESVAWITERKDLLYGLFYLLSLIGYIRYADRQDRRRGGYYAASLVFFVMSALSKPMAISLPLVLVLFDVYPLRRFSRRKDGLTQIAVEKVPYVAITLALGIATIMAQGTSGQIRALHELSPGERCIASLRELSFYVEKLFVPVRLAPFYPLVSPVSFATMDLLRAAWLAGFTAFCIFMWRRNRCWLTAWLFYLLTVAPTLSIVQVGGQAGADRYTYLPLLGPSLMIGITVSAGVEKLWRSPRGLRPYAVAVLGACVIVVALMATATLGQIGIWRDTISLWSREISIFPFNVAVSYQNRGKAYAEAGDHRRAIRDYSTVILMEPGNFRAMTARGMSRLATGDTATACADFAQALRISPGYYQALYYTGLACGQPEPPSR